MGSTASMQVRIISIVGVLSVAAALSAQAPSPNSRQEPAPPSRAMGAPNGKKLVLKDGSYQLIREYTRNGDRVRYYSLERADWEEIPASMIDWVATQKAEAAATSENAAEIEKLKKQEAAARVDMALDVDASLQTSSGVFLPAGEGMFAIQGKDIQLLEQAELETHRDKKQTLKQIFSPIPIVPGKTNIELPGSRAKFRLDPSRLEFYLREAPPDPDRVSAVRKSSRPGESGPEVELIRANVKGSKRLLEEIKDIFGQQLSEDRNVVLLQRWQVAPNIFRFTLGEQLQPGEYALAEMLPDGINLYVWDFGVDKNASKDAKAK